MNQQTLQLDIEQLVQRLRIACDKAQAAAQSSTAMDALAECLNTLRAVVPVSCPPAGAAREVVDAPQGHAPVPWSFDGIWLDAANEALEREERVLRRTDGMLARILGSLNDAIWSVAADTFDVIYVNAAAERVYGRPASEFYSKRGVWQDAIHPEDREVIVRSWPEVFKKGVWEAEYRIVQPDGEVRWVRDRGQAVRDADGMIVRVDGIASDITARKLAEQALRESETRLRRLTAHLESIREEQNAKIAREVHDELGGTLTVLKLGLASVLQKVEGMPKASAQLASLLTLADTAIQTVKRISSSLRPSMLDNLGLAATIKSHAAEFSRLTGIATEARVLQHVELSLERSTAVYRIIQEALTNVARHSGASRVKIRLRKSKAQLVVEVSDNGSGLSAGCLGKPNSYGILGMRERTLYLGGELSIDGLPGGGARLILRVPLEA